MRILIVDDDTELLDDLSYVMQRMGHVVMSCSDGATALEMLKKDGETKPDVILLDVFMPTMSGMEFRRRQLENMEIAEIPCIVISGYPLNGAYRHQLQATNAYYFSKPFNTGDLLKAIEEFDPSRKPRGGAQKPPV